MDCRVASLLAMTGLRGDFVKCRRNSVRGRRRRRRREILVGLQRFPSFSKQFLPGFELFQGVTSGLGGVFDLLNFRNSLI